MSYSTPDQQLTERLQKAFGGEKNGVGGRLRPVFHAEVRSKPKVSSYSEAVGLLSPPFELVDECFLRWVRRRASTSASMDLELEA